MWEILASFHQEGRFGTIILVFHWFLFIEVPYQARKPSGHVYVCMLGCSCCMFCKCRIGVWRRYQRGNQKPYIEEEQITQWSKEKVQKDDIQRSTKHTYKTKDRVTRTPLKTGGELRCSGRVGSYMYCIEDLLGVSTLLTIVSSSWPYLCTNDIIRNRKCLLFESTWFHPGGARVALLFHFVCCAFCFVCPVSCVPNVSDVFGLSLRFSLSLYVVLLSCDIPGESIIFNVVVIVERTF